MKLNIIMTLTLLVPTAPGFVSLLPWLCVVAIHYTVIVTRNMKLHTIAFLWILYLQQGIPYGFQTKFLPVFLRSMSVSLSSISFISFLISLPWILKPLWAPLVDRFGSKITWILGCLLGMAFLYFVASLIRLENMLLVSLIFGGLNILSATQDIVVDAVIVEVFSMEDIGLGNIAQVVGYKSGSLLGGGLLGLLASSYPWQQLFFMLFLTYTFVPIVVILPLFLKIQQSHGTFPKKQEVEYLQIDENEMENNELKRYKEEKEKVFNMVEKYYKIYQTIFLSPGTKWIILYILVYKLGEQGITMIFPMCLMEQGLLSSDIALLNGVWCQSCSILGSFLGGIIARSQTWSCLCSILYKLSTARFLVATLLTWLGSSINVNWYSVVLLDCIFYTISGIITTVTFTVMVLCSQACPDKISATHYSTLATFEVLGKLSMVIISGSLAELLGYNAFFFICISFLCLPIIVLNIPSNYVNNGEKSK